jgi:hypothetical protein
VLLLFKPPPYNGSLSILNEIVNFVITPWWKKLEELNGFDCTQYHPSKKMNKEDRKKLNKALSYHYTLRDKLMVMI